MQMEDVWDDVGCVNCNPAFAQGHNEANVTKPFLAIESRCMRNAFLTRKMRRLSGSHSGMHSDRTR